MHDARMRKNLRNTNKLDFFDELKVKNIDYYRDDLFTISQKNQIVPITRFFGRPFICSLEGQVIQYKKPPSGYWTISKGVDMPPVPAHMSKTSRATTFRKKKKENSISDSSLRK